MVKVLSSFFKGPTATRKYKAQRSTSHTRYSSRSTNSPKKKKILQAKDTAVAKKPLKKRRLSKSNLQRVPSQQNGSVKKDKASIPLAKKLVAPAKGKEKKPPPEFFVGEITHYFQKISVVVVKVIEHPILVGDLIHIKGSAADFMQKVDSLQVESKDVRFARKGELVGLQVREPAKPGDKIYKIKK